MRKILPLILLVLPFLSACKKDEEKPKTKTELLTDKNWRQTAGTADPGLPTGTGTTVTDYWGQTNACYKDDIDRFEKPNVSKHDQGSNVCQGAAQTTVGTWVFSSDETKLTVTINGQSTSYEIVELTENSMKLKWQYPLNGVNHNITDTYTKL